MSEQPIPRNPIHERRLNRRRLLQGVSLTGAGLASSAIGCSSSQKRAPTSGEQASSSSQAAKQPKRGGVLNYAGGPSAGSFDTAGIGFDPTLTLAFSAKGFTLFYERLLASNLRTYKVEPELAQKWEQPSQTEYLFHLQPGVKWHNKPPANGRPLTADDVVWSLQRAGGNDPRVTSRSLLALVDKIESPDKTTVKITTKAPDASTLTKLGVETLAVLAPEVLEKYPKPTTADGVVGTGPFMMSSVEERVGAEYVRNRDYWRPGLPYLDGFRTKHFGDLQTAYAAFEAHSIDLTQMPGSEVKKYIAQQGASYTADWYADDTFASLLMPNTKQKPMDDARVTRALRLLIDHDEFITAWAEVQYGRGASGSIFPTALASWDLTADEYRTQLEWKRSKDDAVKEALSLLNAAGFTKSNPLKFVLTSLSTHQGVKSAAELTQAQWARLGQGVVDAQLRLVDQTTQATVRSNGSFTYGVFGFSVGGVEPDIWLSSTYQTSGSQNYGRFSDAHVDAMIEKQRVTFDAPQRKALIKEITLYMIDHGSTSLGANIFYLQGVNTKVHDHVPENALNGRQYQWVWLAS